jgi:hypothetical protein
MPKKPKRAKTPKAPKGRGGNVGGKDPVTGNNIGPDQGTWTHSNYGYNVLTSPTTKRQFLTGGNNQPIFWDTNKNTYHADSVDKTIGFITYAEALNWPQNDQERHNGSWVIPAGSTTGYMYFGNGELGAYINLSFLTI